MTTGLTHNKVHRLDIVFSLGLKSGIICIDDVFVSDHKCILFDLAFNEDPLPVKRASCSLMINQLA